MFAALIALASFVSAQADELTVFDDGTATCEEVPIRGYWYDTQDYKVQTILPESEFTSILGASITSMKFYIADAGGNQMSGGKLAVSIGSTEQSSYSQWGAAFITTGLTQVAEITMTPGETEIVIDFNEPWVYEGGNILIQTQVVQKGNSPDVKFLGEAAPVYNAAYGQSYPSVGAFYPQTTFTYSGGIEDMAKVTPDAIAFGTVYLDNTATQAITVKNMGKNAFTPVFSGLQAPFSIDAATEVAPGETKTFNVTFTATAVNEYSQTLTVDCGAAGQFEIPVTGVTAEQPAEIVVAEGTATSKAVPVYTDAYDYSAGGNQAQMIYNADLLTDLVGKKINGIKFHASAPFAKLNGGNIQLSIKIVDQDVYDNENKVAIADMTVVATGAPVLGESELVFNFNEPFLYEGGNLAIETLVLQNGEYSFNDYFLGTNTTDYVSYGHFNDLGWETHVYKFLPMATFGYMNEDIPEPQNLSGSIVVSEPTEDGIVTISYTGDEDVTIFVNGEPYAGENIQLVEGENVIVVDVEAVGYNFLEETFTITWTAPVTPPQGMRGDVNGDNEVAIADVSALIDYLLDNSNPANLKNADCNLDENVTIADVAKLIDYLLYDSWD